PKRRFGESAGEKEAGTNFCTATLIGPSTVITAEHCVEGREVEELLFSIGHDASAPRVTAAITRIAIEDSVVGGHLGLGSDVAIVTLAEPVEGVRPWRLAARELEARDVGEQYFAIG